MPDIKLGLVEAHFAEIVWKHAPLTTKELVAICEKELNWKRTTTYTVLKKLCEKGIFATKDRMVTVVLHKEEFRAMQTECFVEQTFQGSLPAFLAAFTTRKMPTPQELQEIKEMLETLGETGK